ncbi:hypothetical protein OPV22_032646 [Ensete ventricosum]|uniref:Rx N-terminal domain-containing protein n=1 Tax=Ensete ventricosum TaxID=4639 RepID=A0AAV8PXX0_ENSVE|nr:hypothetical protein OPV22_032646 [Ensete ventricosum]
MKHRLWLGLKGWSLAAPIGQQLAKVECYFNKIKEATEVIERNKEEDSKRFKNHKIEFDFTILVRIKEGMVDLSSDCIGSRRECNLRPWNSCWLGKLSHPSSIST